MTRPGPVLAVLAFTELLAVLALTLLAGLMVLLALPVAAVQQTKQVRRDHRVNGPGRCRSPRPDDQPWPVQRQPWSTH